MSLFFVISSSRAISFCTRCPVRTNVTMMSAWGFFTTKAIKWLKTGSSRISLCFSVWAAFSAASSWCPTQWSSPLWSPTDGFTTHSIILWPTLLLQTFLLGSHICISCSTRVQFPKLWRYRSTFFARACWTQASQPHSQTCWWLLWSATSPSWTGKYTVTLQSAG